MNAKRILSDALLGLILILLCPVCAQTPFNIYTGAKTEAQLHVFTSEAVTIPLDKGKNLLPLYFRNGGTDNLSAYSNQPAARTGNYTLGFDMTFGEKTVKYFGFTGGGCVYFGETDETRPVSNPWEAFTYYSSSKIDGYVMFRPCIWENDAAGNPRITGDASMTAGEGANIQFEISNNTLYIAYTNILMGQLSLSFQYAFEKDGKFSLLPVSMKPASDAAGESYFALGLMANTLTGSVFIGDYNGGTKTGSYPKLVINSEVFPESGYAYSLMPPAPCRAISQPEVFKWSYEINDTTFEITDNTFRWNEGDRILLVLSKEQTLTGSNLPQNGTEYKAGDKIGSSAGLLTGEILGISETQFSNFKPTSTIGGLQPHTQYYLHAFPYSSTCMGGPVYNTTETPVRAVKTYPLAPTYLRLKDNTLTTTSFSVEIDNENHYLLTTSPKQLATGSPIELNGIYTKGQKIQGTELIVAEPDASAATVDFTGYEAGTDVYLYAWRNMDGGDAYSKFYAACGVSTVHTLPCALNFNSAAVSDDDNHPAPAGWSYEPGNTHRFYTDKNSSLGNFIYTTVGVHGSGKTARTAVVSPVMERGPYQEVTATVNLYFWYEDGGIIGGKLQAGDKLLIQYRNPDGGEDSWQSLDEVTSAAAFSSGKRNHTTPVFTPGEKFQFRFVLVSQYNLDDPNAKSNFAAIYGLSVEPEVSCKAVSALSATELTASSARISWQDANTTAAQGFELRYKKDSAHAVWSQPVSVQQNTYTLTGLQDSAKYRVEVKAVCNEGDSSVATAVSLITLKTRTAPDPTPTPDPEPEPTPVPQPGPSLIPFSVYEGAMENATAHVFSSSATTLNLTAGADLLPLYFRNGGTETLPAYTSAQPAERTGNYNLGFNMTFGEKVVRYFGITGGGCVYFGEEDKIYPASNPWDAYMFATDNAKIQDFVMFRPYRGEKGNFPGEIRPTGTGMKAGSDAKIQFEIADSTLYIAYQNLLITDIGGNTLSLSFQYVFTQDGEFSLIPVSMQPTATPDNTTGDGYYYFTLGLLGDKSHNTVYMRDYNGGASNGAQITLPLNPSSYPRNGKAYRLVPPGACQAVSKSEVTRWGYEVTATTIQMTLSTKWTEGEAALLILSQEPTLSGNNLPVDGIVYQAGNKIGNSVGVITGTALSGMETYTSKFSPDIFRNLQPYTQYYLHAFPYHTACSGGPAYNTAQIPVRPVKTYPAPPAYLRLKEGSLTQNSFTIEIDNAEHYLLAVSSRQISPSETIMPYGTYKKGDKIGKYDLFVVSANDTASTVDFSGYEAGTDVYLYAWCNMGDGTDYSLDYATLGVSTVHTLPCTLDFATAAPNSEARFHPAPAGWSYEAGNAYAVYTANSSSLGNYIYTTVGVNGEGKSARTAIVSPVIDKESYEVINTTVGLYFWYEDEGTIGCSIKDDDSLIIQCRNAAVTGFEGDGAWRTVDAVTSNHGFTSGRRNHVIPSAGLPQKFQFRFILHSKYNLDDPNAKINFAGIYNLSVIPEVNCKAVSSLSASDITVSGATISWLDDNEPFAQAFNLRYKAEDSGVWSPAVSVQQVSHTWTGLESATRYITEVKAVCAPGDTSLVKTVRFATLPQQEEPEACDAPTNLTTSHLTSNSVQLKWKGESVEYAVCYKVRGSEFTHDTLYTDSTEITITSLDPETAYEVFVIGYCNAERTLVSEPSATRYFQTLDEDNVGIEVTEGGKTAVTLRPNPASDKIILSCTTGRLEEITVLNAAGLTVGRKTAGADAAQMVYPVSDLKSGIYFARIKSSEGTVVIKFIVK